MAASNKSVNVLAPNGRRQNVKVTPNTTILQILEEVCKKQGFKPEEYDIKHHNHMLDTTGLIRFSGLPNNAQLELAPASRTREESSVCLGLHLESGERLTGDFLPTDSLWDVIKRLCPEEADPESNPVVIYMRREIQGLLDLETTTLRSLGLTRGRAMLRFVHRTPEQLHHQANVYQLQQIPSASIISRTVKPKTDAPPEDPAQRKAVEQPSVPSSAPMEIDDVLTVLPAVDAKLLQDTKQEKHDEPEIIDSYDSLNLDSLGAPSTSDSIPNIAIKQNVQDTNRRLEEEIVLLGERNALIFSLAMAQSVPYEDLPEDFYDLTLEDARALYRDVKKKRAELEEAPLATTAYRELEESTRVLSQLNTYKRAVLRVEFPDRTVLQGTFLPLETVGMVMDFVKTYLQDPNSKFHLFMTPPKRVLSPDERLVEAGCVPSALLHFGLEQSGQSGASYLREEFLARLTSPSGAALAACQSRGLVPSSRPMSARGPSQTPSSSAVAAGTSREPHSAPGTSRQPLLRQDYGPATKMPKWFKPLSK